MAASYRIRHSPEFSQLVATLSGELRVAGAKDHVRLGVLIELFDPRLRVGGRHLTIEGDLGATGGEVDLGVGHPVGLVEHPPDPGRAGATGHPLDREVDGGGVLGMGPDVAMGLLQNCSPNAGSRSTTPPSTAGSNDSRHCWPRPLGPAGMQSVTAGRSTGPT